MGLVYYAHLIEKIVLVMIIVVSVSGFIVAGMIIDMLNKREISNTYKRVLSMAVITFLFSLFLILISPPREVLSHMKDCGRGVVLCQ